MTLPIWFLDVDGVVNTAKLTDPNPVKAQNVMQAMLQMKKIEIAKLQAAYDRE